MWTEERVELLKTLWAEGLSGSQIAERLGHVTRNAVISKVHRLGLSGRATTSRYKRLQPGPRPKGQRMRDFARPKDLSSPQQAALQGSEIEAPAEVAELVVPIQERKYIDTLEARDCRWPIGDPQHEGFHFCGRKRVCALPYCELHLRRAFQRFATRARERVESLAEQIALAQTDSRVV
ncbi:MAG TPA: GcrA family cell cycle regulator [Candidatus Paceibacterota bacterium]|nr:GcrA family cell cycle regulator [Candidatus Paceibacterota bacterium]